MEERILIEEELVKGYIINKNNQGTCETMVGAFKYLETVEISGITIPSFTKSRGFNQTFHVVSHEAMKDYKIIGRRELLYNQGIDILWSRNQIQWDDMKIPIDKTQKRNGSSTTRRGDTEADGQDTRRKL